MKSLFTYPTEIQQLLQPQEATKPKGRLVAHYELYKKVKHLNGSILKCGITADEGFTRFAIFRQLMGDAEKQPMVAFEKTNSVFETIQANDEPILAVRNQTNQILSPIQQELVVKGLDEKVEFMPGLLSDSIPEYLMYNPELKIALLDVDLEDYEATLTTLDYFYPRIVSGGVLILDNYHQNEGEALAVREFFRNHDVEIQHFSLENGPYFVIKD
jgi:Macrocin-O-methyltransferase (TylF)